MPFRKLQMPVFDRAGAAVGLVQVDLGNGQVAAHHLQGAVPQDGLQGVDITTVAQKVDREGVAKAVRVHVWNAGALGRGVEQFEQLAAVHLVALFGQDQIVVDAIVGPAAQVIPDDLGRARRNGDDAVLAALPCQDLDRFVFVAQIHVFDAQLAQLGGAQACVE